MNDVSSKKIYSILWKINYLEIKSKKTSYKMELSPLKSSQLIMETHPWRMWPNKILTWYQRSMIFEGDDGMK